MKMNDDQEKFAMDELKRLCKNSHDVGKEKKERMGKGKKNQLYINT
jgi:hypothetical protein